MKRKVEHPAPSARELSGPKYWRSLDELAATPGFQAQLEREFPQGAAEMNGVDRRHFMKIMAASFALGGIGLAGCRRPEQNILPFGKSIEGIIPGLPQYYATAMPLRGSAIPLLAETHQGRPTKLEGNPTYTPHGSATSLLAQASILDLYDPDRAMAHTKGGVAIKADAVNDLLATIGKSYEGTQGAGLAFLADGSKSPTRARLVKALRAKLPKAVWSEYEPIADEPPIEVAQACFGGNFKPVYRFDKAKCILSLDGDFLSAESGSLYYARGFAAGRRVTKKEDPMNRLYVAESNLTLTGSMADHRLRIASSHVLALAAAIAAELVADNMKGSVQAYAQGLKVDAKWVAECAADLKSFGREALVVAGSHQPASVHALAYGLNVLLGSVGTTVDFVAIEAATASSIGDLAAAIKSNAVKTLVILGGNPAYNAPADLDLAKAIKSVGDVVRLGYFVDETSAVSGTHLAAAHYLESWGDARTADGTIVPVQPMILPLFNGLTELEVIARISGDAKADGYALVSETIGTIAGGDKEKAIRRFLHDGLLAGSAYPVQTVRFDAQGAVRVLGSPTAVTEFSGKNLEVRFVADHKMDDGRFANNGWLQECPDPITRITWDNAILVSPKLGKELGLDPKGALFQVARKEENEFNIGKETGHIFELTVDGRKIRGPLHIQAGLSNYTVIVPLGYGRGAEFKGRVAAGSGFSGYPLVTTKAMNFQGGATLAPAEGKSLLANVQEHWSMEGRELVREGNYSEYVENPGFLKDPELQEEVVGEYGKEMTPQQRATEIPRGGSLYSTPKFDGIHQWGMSIDLNTCIGCNACVVACQAENNIPIVGKDQVLRGREMHWIRIDRYYSDGHADAEAFGAKGNLEIPEEPQISLQPIACMQCEMAPCETVCPVNATVHDPEGLNTMAYNRCIGTRYCANNCPYKVRRFNFFDWNQRSLDQLYMSQLAPYGMPELVKMAKNPEVTVRMRGVMEKCTYCVQRIQNGKIQHKVKVAQAGSPGEVEVPDGTIKTACQQVCPVEAIEFGNILDPKSKVSLAKAREQDYELLGYLNIRPRTTYLGKLRNPNPKMPGGDSLPFSRIEHDKKNYPAGFKKAEEGATKKESGHVMNSVMKHLGGLS
jgi:MoCo/4Fe-4S cofactor protein with predicted Tat translocation signal